MNLLLQGVFVPLIVTLIDVSLFIKLCNSVSGTESLVFVITFEQLLAKLAYHGFHIPQTL